MGVKFLFTADFHLYNEDRFSGVDGAGRTEHLRTQMKTLYEISKIALHHRAILVIGGDVPEQKDRVPSVILNSFFRWVVDCESQLIIFTGNHDAALVEQPSIRVAGYLPDVTFLNTPELILVEPDGFFQIIDTDAIIDSPEGKLIGVIPHQQNEQRIGKIIEGWPNVDILFIHQLIEGATVGKYQLPGNLRTGAFAQVPIVFAGDIHKAQSIGNIHYVGAPYQNNFGEEGYEPRVILFDIDEPEKFESIPLGGPTYLTVEVTVEPEWLTDSYWWGRSICGDFVKLKISCTPEQFKELNQSEIREFFYNNFSIQGLVFEWNFIKQEREIVVSESTEPLEAIGNYVKACGPEELGKLDKIELEKIGRGLLV